MINLTTNEFVYFLFLNGNYSVKCSFELNCEYYNENFAKASVNNAMILVYQRGLTS